MPRALVTGGAGFIGSHLVDRLIGDQWHVTVIDNFDPFYDESIKRNNISDQLDNDRYQLIEADIRDAATLEQLTENYDVIVHLAAKAGVRPSIADPMSYQTTNVIGTQNMLEFARNRGIKQFVFASSSSVYGINPNVPWREDDPQLMPISPYASTKVSCELMGHVYSHLFGIRFVGLRFFTVYGPRQRPDLAINKFARLHAEDAMIPVFGDGSTSRDYTFVADIVSGIRSAMDYDASDYEIINLGNHQTVTLTELIETLGNVLGSEFKIDRQPAQPGDVPRTFADVSKAKRLLGYEPTTGIESGLKHFAHWFNQRGKSL